MEIILNDDPLNISFLEKIKQSGLVLSLCLKIEISDLSVDYKTSRGNIHALENVEFQLEDGESIGIAGESACGKSTLGLTIIRMLQGGNIVSGKITFSGESILDMPDSKFDGSIRWKEISMIFQGAMNSLDPVFTIKQQFDESAKTTWFWW